MKKVKSPRSPRTAAPKSPRSPRGNASNKSPRSPRGIRLPASLGKAAGSKKMLSPRRRFTTQPHLSHVEDDIFIEDQYEHCTIKPCEAEDEAAARYDANVVSTYKMTRRSNIMLYCIELLVLGKPPSYTLFSLEEIHDLRALLSTHVDTLPPVKLRRDERGEQSAQIARISSFFAFLMQSDSCRTGSDIVQDIIRNSFSYQNLLLEVRILSVELPLLDATTQIHMDETLRLSKISPDTEANLRAAPKFVKVMQRLACCKGIPPSNDAMFAIVSETQLAPLLAEAVSQDSASRELNFVTVVNEHLRESGLPADAQVKILAKLSRKSNFDDPLEVRLTRMHQLVAKTASEVQKEEIKLALEGMVQRSGLSHDRYSTLYASGSFQALLDRALQPEVSTKDMASIMTQLKRLVGDASNQLEDTAPEYEDDSEQIQL